MESSEFSNTSDVRAALGSLLKLTSEPKSMEIRKSSKRAIIALFDLNAASLSLMLHQQPQPLQVSDNARMIFSYHCSMQDDADKILKSYIQTVSSDEGEFSSPSPSAGSLTSKVPSSHAFS